MSKQGKIYYLCDGKACKNPNRMCVRYKDSISSCQHTTKIEHAKNFELKGMHYREKHNKQQSLNKGGEKMDTEKKIKIETLVSDILSKCKTQGLTMQEVIELPEVLKKEIARCIRNQQRETQFSIHS